MVDAGPVSGGGQSEAGVSDPGGAGQEVSWRAERAGRTPEHSVPAAGPGQLSTLSQTHKYKQPNHTNEYTKLIKCNSQFTEIIK